MTHTASDLPMRRYGFRAMGTRVEVIAPVAGVPDERFQRAARRVELEFEEQEERFSRFRPSSELPVSTGPRDLRSGSR